MYQIYNLVQMASGIGTLGHGGPWPQKKVTRRLGLQTLLLPPGPFGKDPFKGDHRQAPFHLAGPVPVPWTLDTGFQVPPGHTMVPPDFPASLSPLDLQSWVFPARPAGGACRTAGEITVWVPPEWALFIFYSARVSRIVLFFRGALDKIPGQLKGI